MSILAIETASSVSSVAVASEGKLRAEVTVEAGRTHSETLLSHIEGALSFAGVERPMLTGVAVSIGPGSFTGLRIGLATAKAIAYGLGIPLVGVPTLAALALAFPVPGVCRLALMDAQKGNAYAGLYEWKAGALHEVRPVCVAPLAEAVAEAAALGKPVVLTGELVKKRRARLGELPENVALAPAHFLTARASCVAWLGQERLSAGESDDPMTLEPFYIRRSEAEVLWEKRHGAAKEEAPC